MMVVLEQFFSPNLYQSTPMCQCVPMPEPVFVVFQPVFDEFYISCYNMVYTSLPVVILGAVDQDVSARSSMKFSGLYTPGITNLWFSRQKFANFAIHGLSTSLVLIGFIMGRSQGRCLHEYYY